MAKILVAEASTGDWHGKAVRAHVFLGGSIHEGNMLNHIKLQPKGDFSSFYLLNKV
jgi:hypothetical protein